MNNIIQNYKIILKELTLNCSHIKSFKQIRQPKMSNIEHIALHLTAEYMSINTKCRLFRCINGTELESKITAVPMTKLATKYILGAKQKDMGYQNGLLKEKTGIYVKVPVFSFSKLHQVDISLCPEMKSTGEMMGKDTTLEKALYKGLVAAGRKIPTQGSILFTVADKHKAEAAAFAKRFSDIGFRILATTGTAKFFKDANIPTDVINKVEAEENNLLDLIQKGNIQFVVNTLTKGKKPERDGFQIRRASVENAVPCLTSMDTVEALLKVIESRSFEMKSI